jgi:hypothetical protein
MKKAMGCTTLSNKTNCKNAKPSVKNSKKEESMFWLKDSKGFK